MTAPDLDRLLRQIRENAPAAPDHLVAGVIERLGPSASQVRAVLWAGIASCLAAVALAAWIGSSPARWPVEEPPPELTLLTRGTGPLASL